MICASIYAQSNFVQTFVNIYFFFFCISSFYSFKLLNHTSRGGGTENFNLKYEDIYVISDKFDNKVDDRKW
jgi:hypothetical protein